MLWHILKFGNGKQCPFPHKRSVLVEGTAPNPPELSASGQATHSKCKRFCYGNLQNLRTCELGGDQNLRSTALPEIKKQAGNISYNVARPRFSGSLFSIFPFPASSAPDRVSEIHRCPASRSGNPSSPSLLCGIPRRAFSSLKGSGHILR